MFAEPAPISQLTQFEKGERVRVRPLVCNRHRGETGVVLKVRLDQRGVRVLDKYIVRFDDNDQEEFWGIQLETDGPPRCWIA